MITSNSSPSSQFKDSKFTPLPSPPEKIPTKFQSPLKTDFKLTSNSKPSSLTPSFDSNESVKPSLSEVSISHFRPPLPLHPLPPPTSINFQEGTHLSEIELNQKKEEYLREQTLSQETFPSLSPLIRIPKKEEVSNPHSRSKFSIPSFPFSRKQWNNNFKSLASKLSYSKVNSVQDPVYPIFNLNSDEQSDSKSLTRSFRNSLGRRSMEGFIPFKKKSETKSSSFQSRQSLDMGRLSKSPESSSPRKYVGLTTSQRSIGYQEKERNS